MRVSTGSPACMVAPYGREQPWGDSAKAKTIPGWNVQYAAYTELVEIMTKHNFIFPGSHHIALNTSVWNDYAN